MIKREEDLWIIISIFGVFLCLSLFILMTTFPKATQINIKATVIGTAYNYEPNVMKLCSTSSVKTYMDYRSITNTRSKQYKYIKEHMSVNHQGLLVDKDGFIGVALSSRYGIIGSKFKIILDTGTILNVVKIDEKSSKHTDSENCVQKWDGSFLEIVIDKDIAGKYYGVAKNNYVLSGNFNNSKDFNGKIEKVVIVR